MLRPIASIETLVSHSCLSSLRSHPSRIVILCRVRKAVWGGPATPGQFLLEERM